MSVMTDEEIMALEEPEIDRAAELECQALAWPDKAKSVQVVDQQSYDDASQKLLIIMDLQKQIKNEINPLIKQAKDLHQSLCDKRSAALDPLESAEKEIKSKVGAWVMEQERIRREIEQKAREEAARIEEEMRLAAALSAERMGADDETIQEALERPIPVSAPVIASTFQKQSGVNTKKTWRWEVADINKIPDEYWMLNESMIGAMVRNGKGKIAIPGIRIIEDITVAAGRR